VVLSALADVDFLATLLLAGTSKTLRDLILDQIVTMATFSRFLREHQYVLHHDKFGRLFSSEEIVWLHQAFETLQNRHGPSLYEETFSVIGPLLCRIPFKIFKASPGLPPDFSIRENPDKKGRSRGVCGLSSLELLYKFRLDISWLHT